jgi:short-subunit dehydrogenase
MNKLAVITGGTKGIGNATVLKFLSEGFDVISCSRNSTDLESLSNEVASNFASQKFWSQQADLSIKSDITDFAKFIKDIGRPVDVLVNNAGLFIPGAVHNEETGNLELMIETNLYSAYYLTRELIEDMKVKKTGHIFTIGSVASIQAYENGGSYSVSKFALLGFTKSLREEMKPFGVKVTSILPGATLTASWDGVDLPASRFIKPEDIASTIYGAYTLSDSAVVEEILVRPQLGDI